MRECIENRIRFDGSTVNYDKDKKPFVMHWRVIPVINNERD